MKRSRARSLVVIIVLALLLCLTSGFVITVAGGRASAQAMEPRFYDIGSPALKDIWVDPAHGDDGNTGDERGSALRSLSAAWEFFSNLKVTVMLTAPSVMVVVT